MTNSTDFEAFRHGLIVSKIWLCEELESIVSKLNLQTPTVHILGGWQNVLGFMMQVRKPNFYKEINSYDKDEHAKVISDMICDAWKFENSKINNFVADINDLTFSEGIFINCSVDQFEGTTWYDVIPKNSLVCLQTTTIMDNDPRWEITQRTPDMDSFVGKYPMREILFKGMKEIRYHHFGYDRLMMIGVK